MEVVLGLIPGLCQNKQLCLPHIQLSPSPCSALGQGRNILPSTAILNKEPDSFGQLYPFLPPSTQLDYWQSWGNGWT